MTVVPRGRRQAGVVSADGDSRPIGAGIVDVFQAIAAVEGVLANRCQSRGQGYRDQGRAAIEGVVADEGDALRNNTSKPTFPKPADLYPGL